MNDKAIIEALVKALEETKGWIDPYGEDAETRKSMTASLKIIDDALKLAKG